METKEVLQSNAGFMSYWEYKHRKRAAAKAAHDAIFRHNDGVFLDYLVIKEMGVSVTVIRAIYADEYLSQKPRPSRIFPDIEEYPTPEHYSILYPNSYWEKGVYVFEDDPEMLGFEEFIYRKVTNSVFLLNYIIDTINNNKRKTRKHYD